MADGVLLGIGLGMLLQMWKQFQVFRDKVEQALILQSLHSEEYKRFARFSPTF